VSRARREAAAARREGALADLAEMDVLERRGDLIPAADARAQVIDRYTVVKTKILGVPSRVAQRLPHVARADVAVIEDLLREALIELASDDARSDTGST
jgi:phage terminase Nu1 subunit (DNA packaging protein)